MQASDRASGPWTNRCIPEKISTYALEVYRERDPTQEKNLRPDRAVRDSSTWQELQRPLQEERTVSSDQEHSFCFHKIISLQTVEIRAAWSAGGLPRNDIPSGRSSVIQECGDFLSESVVDSQ